MTSDELEGGNRQVPPLNLTEDELGIALTLVDRGELPGFVIEEGLVEEYQSLLKKLRRAES